MLTETFFRMEENSGDPLWIQDDWIERPEIPENIVFKAQLSPEKYYLPNNPNVTNKTKIKEELGNYNGHDLLAVINEQKSKIVFEKTFSQTEFQTFLFEFIKTFQNKPTEAESQETVQQPKSLLSIAAIQTAMHLGKTQKIESASKNVCTKIIEEYACKLEAVDLAEFIQVNKGILQIKEKFSIDGFQRFVMHFYRTFERIDLHENTKKQLEKCHENFAENFKLHKVKTKKNSNNQLQYSTCFDWETGSLGLSCNVITQQCASKTQEYQFFSSKFDNIVSSHRLIPPEVPAKLENVIPKEDDVDTNCLSTPSGPKYPEPEKKSENPTKAFHEKLLGMCESFRNGAYHETLAYAVEILSCNSFQFYPSIIHFFLYVWGMLSVTLAKLRFEPIYAFSCIHVMQKYVRFYADEIDVLFYQQQVFATFGMYSEENKIFQQLMAMIAKISDFYPQIIKVHLTAQIQNIENDLFQIKCINQDKELKWNLECIGKKHKLINKTKQKIFKLQQFLYQQCGKLSEFGLQNLLLHIEILELYKIAVEFLETRSLAQKRFRIEQIAMKIDRSNHHLDFFTSMYSQHQDYTLHDYLSSLRRHQKSLELKTHIYNPEIYADHLFSHMLLMSIFTLDVYQTSIFFEDALAIYEQTGNERKNHMNYYRRKKSDYEAPNIDTSIYRNCCISWIVKTAKTIKEQIRLGIVSVNNFDTLY